MITFPKAIIEVHRKANDDVSESHIKEDRKANDNVSETILKDTGKQICNIQRHNTLMKTMVERTVESK